MLSADSQLLFAVLLAAFCHIQTGSHKNLGSSRHRDNTLVKHGFGNEIQSTQCSWNCTVIESDLSEEMKTTITKNRLIRLVVKYEKKVDDKCVNQTPRNLSGNATEHLQIWLANKQHTFAKAMESLVNLMFYTDPNEEHKIRAMCILKPTMTTATNPVHNSGIQFPLFFRGHLADRGVAFDTIDCNTEEMDNLQPCVNISKSTGNNGINSTNSFERGGWPVTVLYCLYFVFLAVFIHYSPAFLCLFSPTEVTEDGVRHIILEGASPVSFRSPVANYFFSENDGTIWHKARKFILRVVVMPLPFVGPAIFTVSFKSFGFSFSDSFQQFMIVCSGCYCISALYISFFTARSFKAKPCFVCKLVKPQIVTCQDELPRLIINHLRFQPLILVECWRLFIRCLKSYFKILLILLPSRKVSIVYLLRFSIFIVFLFAIPAVAVILLIAILLVTFIGILLTSPIVILCKARTRTIIVPLFIVFVIRYVAVLATVGAIIVLLFAGIAILYVLVLGFALLFSEESLPYVACFILVLYYVWSSYSSFTNKYHDLGLALFKRYKRSRHDKFTEMTLSINPVQENTPNAATNNEDNVMKIPKELFHIACEELVPIREGVCILILKITIIVSFVLMIFSLTMQLNVGATPFMKALMTFLTGIFPKIVAIYIDGGRQKKLEAMITDEKIPKIVQEYINKTSGSNQAQENCGANIDEVVILVNANEENIELVNM